MNKMEWWYRSGEASAAAHELAWFVTLVFVGIAVVLWWDNKHD